MKSNSIMALALVLGALPLSASATLLSFDFEDLPDYGEGALLSNGFVFDFGDVDGYPGPIVNPSEWRGHYHLGGPGGYSQGADNGTKYLIFDYSLADSRLNIYGDSGQVFGLRRFDLAEAYVSECFLHPSAVIMEQRCGVTFVGQLTSGGTITRHVVLDGIADGTGPLVDFQTFAFDEQWDALSLFSIVSTHGYLNPGLDNLVLRTIPEPASLALLGTGMLSLLGLRRRGKRALG